MSADASITERLARPVVHLRDALNQHLPERAKQWVYATRINAIVADVARNLKDLEINYEAVPTQTTTVDWSIGPTGFSVRNPSAISHGEYLHNVGDLILFAASKKILTPETEDSALSFPCAFFYEVNHGLCRARHTAGGQYHANCVQNALLGDLHDFRRQVFIPGVDYVLR